MILTKSARWNRSAGHNKVTVHRIFGFFATYLLLSTVWCYTATGACLNPPGDVTGEQTTSVLDVQCQILSVLAAISETKAPPCLIGGFSAGDHNCDGEVNTTDILLVITFALGGTLSPELDTNGDGCVDVCYCVANPGASCDDLDGCTTNDRCTNGTCFGVPNTCNDNNPCTEGSCDAAAGCVYAPVFGPCEDGNPCTTPDFCDSGVCVAGPTMECADGDFCTDDECSPTFGGCVHPYNTAPCSDGNPCTTGDVCASGQCVSGTTTLACNDGNPCTNDSCNPAVGCQFVPAIAKPCNDNNLCTLSDICVTTGACLGQPKICDDSNLCTTDTCNTASGACTFTNNTLNCDDGDDCTVKDGCGKGACLPGLPKVCNDNNVCTNDVCGKGGCIFTPTGIKPCDDGNSCTFQDQCTNGICAGIPAASPCDDGKPCTLDSCLSTGGCLHAYAPVGACPDEGCWDMGCDDVTYLCEPKGYLDAFAPCDDGDPCTLKSHCQPSFLGLSCEGNTPKNCDDDNPCTKDQCNSALDGVCQSVLEPNGTPCLNASGCLGQCVTGSCNSALACDDSNACTADYCEPEKCDGKEFQGGCYKIFDGTIYVGKTWGQAEEACQTWGGHLTSVTSDAENDFVANLLKNGPYVLEFRPFLHIGAINYLPPQGKFQWTDGQPFNFVKWAANLPGNAFEPGRTIAIWVGTGVLGDEEHWTTVSGAKGPYVCERPAQGWCYNNPQCASEKPACNLIHGAGGCNDVGCEWCVCRQNAACCLSSWEAGCIGLAGSDSCSSYCGD